MSDEPKPKPQPPPLPTPAEVLQAIYIPKIVVSGTGTVSWPEGHPRN